MAVLPTILPAPKLWPLIWSQLCLSQTAPGSLCEKRVAFSEGDGIQNVVTCSSDDVCVAALREENQGTVSCRVVGF